MRPPAASEPDDSAALGQRLDILIALVLCQLEGKNEPRDVMTALARTKVPPREIAALLGVTPNAVSIALHRSRKAGKAKKAKPAPRQKT